MGTSDDVDPTSRPPDAPDAPGGPGRADRVVGDEHHIGTLSLPDPAAVGKVQHAFATLARGRVAVDIGGMMERPGLDLFARACARQSILGTRWFTTGEAQEMPNLAGPGVLDLSVLEHHIALEKISEALNGGQPAQHGGFTNFMAAPEHAALS